MRLIDADELLKYMEITEIRQYIDEINKGNDNYSSTVLYEYIKDIPTAYDVEKVVERLEVNSMFAHADDEPFVMLDDAVEIVKSGGIGTVGKEKNDGNQDNVK